MSLKQRLTKAEQAASVDSEPVIIFIVRHAHDYDGAIEDLPVTISKDGKVHRFGINTVPEHLRQPVRHIQLAWPEDEQG